MVSILIKVGKARVNYNKKVYNYYTITIPKAIRQITNNFEEGWVHVYFKDGRLVLSKKEQSELQENYVITKKITEINTCKKIFIPSNLLKLNWKLAVIKIIDNSTLEVTGYGREEIKSKRETPS